LSNRHFQAHDCQRTFFFRPTPGLPVPAEYSQVQGRTHHRPLGLDAFPSPYRPPPKAVVLFNLPKARFDDPGALFPEGSPVRVLQSPPHRLNFLPVRPDFDLPSFGIARALRPRRTVPTVTTIAFHPLPVFGGLAFVVQDPALGTSNGANFRIVAEVLRG